MPQHERRQFNFRCDPKLYKKFADLVREKDPKGGVNVGGELVKYMNWVVNGVEKPNLAPATSNILHIEPKGSVYNSPRVVEAAVATVESAKALEAALKTAGALSERELSEDLRAARAEVQDISGRIGDAADRISDDEEEDGSAKRSDAG